MIHEPDILGRDEPARQVPRWVRPLTVGVALCLAVGSFVVSQGEGGAPAPSPAPSRSSDSVDDALGRTCGPNSVDGLAWGAPIATLEPGGRLATWRVHVCNEGSQPVTIESLRPLSRAERNLAGEQVNALRRANVPIDESNTDALPVRIPAGGSADVMTVSAVLGCERSNLASGLTAAVRRGDAAKRLDMPVRRPAVVPAELWCNRLGDAETAVPLLRDGPLSVLTGTRRIDVSVALLNPNDLPVSLTGLFDPSPGVRASVTSAVTVPAGGRASVSARLNVATCAGIFLDAPWQLTFKGDLGGKAAHLAPVRVDSGDWQRPALRRICPAERPLTTTTRPAELKVSGPFARGDPTTYLVTQVVRNVGDSTVLLRLHPRSAPGMQFVGVDVIPAAGAHAAVGGATGSPLRQWSMPPGAEAFLTYFYRLGGDTQAGCLAPPIDRWRAPVDAVDTAGRAVTVADESTRAPQVPQSWIGGWRVGATEGCARAVRLGPAAPFLVFNGPSEATADAKDMRYSLTLYGIPGGSAATLSGARLVGAFADLAVQITPPLGTISPQQVRGISVLVPIHCPPPGVAVTLALSYRLGAGGELPPVLVELQLTPVATGQLC